MNNISIAHETMKITEDGFYELNGQKIDLPDIDYNKVMVFSPEEGEVLLELGEEKEPGTAEGKIVITTEDTYQAASRYDNVLAMNFANAHVPGGGFLMGATAQEEALCRCSTLYASITSKPAKEMYNYNNLHPGKVESDYMMLSPQVVVFRNQNCELLEKPFVTGVITIAAPDRLGAAFFASKDLIKETMIRRIRIMFEIAIENGFKNLVLGAWGCGAFHNEPADVSKYFKQVLVDEGYKNYFDEICFAIYGKPDGKNITAFKKMFDMQ